MCGSGDCLQNAAQHVNIEPLGIWLGWAVTEKIIYSLCLKAVIKCSRAVCPECSINYAFSVESRNPGPCSLLSYLLGATD